MGIDWLRGSADCIAIHGVDLVEMFDPVPADLSHLSM